MKFIGKVSDGVNRVYSGFYDEKNETYVLKQDGQEDLIKNINTIKEGLFSPFYQLKLIHEQIK